MKVLIVDDEPLVVRSLQKVFALHGHEVVTAENGPAGLQAWLQEKPKLILLDLMMPGLSGIEVLQAIVEKQPDWHQQTTVVLMSAFTGDADFSAVRGPKPHLFLKKPFDDIFKVYQSVVDLVQRSS